MYKVTVVERPRHPEGKVLVKEVSTPLALVFIAREIGAKWLVSGDLKVLFESWDEKAMKLWMDGRSFVMDGDSGVVFVSYEESNHG